MASDEIETRIGLWANEINPDADIPDLTWDQVRARSEFTSAGLKLFCGDCWMNYEHSGFPCRKHCTPEESEARDRWFTRRINALARPK